MIHRVAFRMALRDIRGSKKFLFAAIVSAVPPILALLGLLGLAVDGYATYWPMVPDYLFLASIGVAIPLTCLLLAGGSIADEAEERTLSYLLVRPVSRSQLFYSRSVAVAVLAVGLSLIQTMATWLVDMLAWAAFAEPGATVHAVGLAGQSIEAPMAQVVWLALPATLVAAAGAALLYTGMFSAVSVVFTRYHFFANFAWFVLWEWAIGSSHVAPAWLSGNHAWRLVAFTIDPGIDPLSYADDGRRFVAMVVAPALIILWWWLGGRIATRRDFHVTSAAT